MKFIEKGAEPGEFSAWKRTQIPEPVYSSCSGRPLKALREALIQEQGYICCYCGSRITGSEDSQVEHFRPKSLFPDLQVEYSNLLASCNGGEANGGSRRNLHCNPRKDNWFVEGLMVSPLIQNCKEFFRYSATGEVTATTDSVKNEAAKATINALNLNCYTLKESRRNAIRELTRLIAELQTKGALDYQALMTLFSERDSDGRYEPFCAALVYVLQSMTRPPLDHTDE